MQTREKLLFHQIHPIKLLVDWSTAAIASWLLWDHRLAPALLVGLVPSAVASLLMVRYGDFTRQARSVVGAYVRRYMTPQVQAVRLVGIVGVWVGAWRHDPILMVTGVGVILVAWFRGVLVPTR